MPNSATDARRETAPLPAPPRFARGILFGVGVLVLIAVLLPNTTIAWMRLNWRWFNAPLLLVERIGGPVNLVHAGLFLLLGFMIAFAFPRWRWLGAGVALLAFGAGSELLQLFAPGRHVRFSDVAVDLAAGLLGWMCARWMQHLRRKRAGKTGSP